MNNWMFAGAICLGAMIAWLILLADELIHNDVEHNDDD